jgi:hypothetical protein
MPPPNSSSARPLENRRAARKFIGVVDQIAQELRLGIKSVETYRARVMDKLGLTSRSDLVRFALESGVLGPGKPA